MKPSMRGAPKKPGRPPKKKSRAPRENATGPRKGGLRPLHYFLTAGALGAVLVAVLLAVLLLSGAGDGSPERKAAGGTVGRPAESGHSPSSYSSTGSTAAYAAIEERGKDPKPLTIEESFPKRAQTIEVPDTRVELSLKEKRLDGDCAAAVWGGGIGDALRQGGCTQAVRGVYADTERGYALTVAVFNLEGKEHADRLVARFGSGGGFVQPLPAQAPLDKVGQGFSVARGLAMGHYAVVSWAQRLDGGGDAEDETLLSLLIEGGKPPSALGRAARVPPPAG